MVQHRNKRLPLTAPITMGDQTLTEVSVKKPKVKDLKTLQDALAGIEDQLEQGIIMAAVLTDLPREAIEDMDTDDFTAISEVIAGFFPKGHGIRDWRAITAETAHWLNTSITDLMDMDWPELVLWHAEARRLARAAIPK